MTHLDNGTALSLKKNIIALKGTLWNNLHMCVLSGKSKEHNSIYGKLFLKMGRYRYVSIYRDKLWMDIQNTRPRGCLLGEVEDWEGVKKDLLFTVHSFDPFVFYIRHTYCLFKNNF